MNRRNRMFSVHCNTELRWHHSSSYSVVHLLTSAWIAADCDEWWGWALYNESWIWIRLRPSWILDLPKNCQNPTRFRLRFIVRRIPAG